MGAIIESMLALLAEVSPILKTADAISKVISFLIDIYPVAKQEVEDVAQPIKNIIAALSSNPDTTLEQLTQLRELDAKIDADFDAEAARVEAEDAGDNGSNPPAAQTDHVNADEGGVDK